jgi:hypothetical protein
MLATWFLLTLLADADAGAPAVPVLSRMPAAAQAVDASTGGVGAGNLLRRATLVRKDGAPDAERMADGNAPSDGDHWQTKYTAVLAPGGAVEWDLGMVRPIGAVRLQADNNDTYVLSASVDGVHFSRLWIAKTIDVPGMQTRTSEPLAAQARYLRLTAEGGDAMYSVGELEVFESVQDLVGAQLNRIPLPPPPRPVPPPPIDSGLLVTTGVAAYVAYLLQQARKRNLAAKQATLPGAPKPVPGSSERDEKKS